MADGDEDNGRAFPTRLRLSAKALRSASRARRWLNRILVPHKRDARRLLRERPQHIFQPGGGTSLDRYPHLFAALRDQLEVIQSPSVLSFGCSTGEEILSLRSYLPHARLSGIDINPSRIRAARKRINDPTVSLSAAANIEEAGGGRYDAITCLSVMHRRELLRDWPADGTKYMTFEMFERAILDFDRHLKPGGALLLYHTSFRFIETSVALNYTPLLLVDPLSRDLTKQYDRNNRPILEPLHERFALWRKEQ